MVKEKQRNGKIEFARFAFAILIMLFHIGDDLLPSDFRIFDKITFFSNGYFGVEFFFAVSGYLMAATAFKRQSTQQSLGRETFEFMKRKLMSVLPYHLIVFTITFIGVCILSRVDIFEFLTRALQAIPNLLFVQRSGLANKDILGVEWYISDMLIAMYILYPICLKYYDKFTRIIAPVTSLLIIGYLIKTTGSLNGSTAWSVIVAKTFLRAVSEICAGVFTFEVCRNINKLNFTKKDKVLLTIFEVVSYLIVLGFIVLDVDNKYAGTIFIFACTAICLSFSDVTYGKKLFNNKVVYFLGSLSLPLYLCHSLTRRVINSAYKNIEAFNDLGVVVAIVVFFVISFAFVFVAMPLEKVLRKAINNKLEQLSIKKQ